MPKASTTKATQRSGAPTNPYQLPGPAARDAFAATLLGHYRKTARKLPWRDNPTAYGVWVSEMMLQQTQVATVLPYYQRWMDRFPTLESLANAPQADVLGLWQGLGYYARARALHAGASHVMQKLGGQLPRTAPELQQLPGIGPYTAGAIASIAFEEPAPIVDGNVIRVLSRVFGLEGSPVHQPLKGFLWELAGALVPKSSARDFNQALMEFGALCCTPKSPLCHECSMRPRCTAYATRAVDRLPELPKRPQVTSVVNVAALIMRHGKLLVGQLPEGAPRWPSMWQLPNVNLEPEETETQGLTRVVQTWCGSRGTLGKRQHSLTHSVTRYRITVNLFDVHVSGEPKSKYCQALTWVGRREVDDLAMPSAHRKLALRVLGD